MATRSLLMYQGTHEATLRAALVRLKLWATPDRQLPAPHAVSSGVAGKSAVYFVYLPRDEGHGREIVAKFDEADRQALEWQAISDLRSLNNPPEVLLPIAGNEPMDQVIVFDAASGLAGQLQCETLLQVFRQQLSGNPHNCTAALDALFKVLGRYYQGEPGAARPAAHGNLIRWESAYPDHSNNTVVRKMLRCAARHWPGIDWQREKTFYPTSLTGIERSLPNPFFPLTHLLAEKTGVIMQSQIHGDLNLSNVMVSLKRDGSFDRAFVIDLTNCEPNRIQAIDFSRIEVEVWRHVFAASELPEQELYREFLSVRDYLDGRSKFIPQCSPFSHGCVTLVNHLRSVAHDYLNPAKGSKEPYLLSDYMRCLYFASLGTLKHATVARSPVVSRVMLLSAALALEYKEELQRGLYAPGASVDRSPIPRNPDGDASPAPMIFPTRSESMLRDSVARFSNRAREALQPMILPHISRRVVDQKYLPAIRRGTSEQKRRIIPIIGPGGFGKSTILGEIYDKLQLECAWVALIRCNDLALSGNVSFKSLNLVMGEAVCGESREIASAIRLLREELGTGVLLIDTVDLIIDERLAPAFQHLLGAILDSESTIVYTCRDHEYSAYLEDPESRLSGVIEATDRYQVPAFEPDEIERAALQFLKSRPDILLSGGPSAFARGILELSADNRSLQEITRNPLLLALLCDLFAREGRVPRDLTVSKLYAQYWAEKVGRTRRHGRPSTLTMMKDSLCLDLAKRFCELSHDRLRESIFESDAGIPATDLAMAAYGEVLSEGILKRTSAGRIYFFHQTFLEYAIARWLSTHAGQAARERLFAELRSNEYLAGRIHWWPVVRQVLSIVDTAEVLALVRSLDLTNLPAFRAAVTGAVAREDDKLLNVVFTAARSANREFGDTLRESLESVSEALAPRAWEMLVTMLQEVDWWTAVKTAQSIGEIFSRWQNVIGDRLDEALSALEHRPLEGRAETNESTDLVGRIVERLAGTLLQPNSLHSLRRRYVTLGGATRLAIVELHLQPGVNNAAQRALLDITMQESFTRRMEGRHAAVTKEVALLLQAVLPAAVREGDALLGHSWFEALHASLPETLKAAQAEAIARSVKTMPVVVREILLDFLQGPSDRMRQNFKALIDAASGEGAVTVCEVLTAVPAEMIAKRCARPIGALLRQLSSILPEERLAALRLWCAPLVMTYPDEFIHTALLLGKGSPAAIDEALSAIRQQRPEVRSRLLPKIARLFPDQLSSGRAHEIDASMRQTPRKSSRRESAKRRADLLAVSLERARAKTRPDAIARLVDMCTNRSKTVAIAAASALLSLSSEQFGPTVKDLQLLLNSNWIGVRVHALDAMMIAFRRMRVQQDAELITLCRTLKDEAADPVLRSLYALIQGYVRLQGKLSPDAWEPVHSALNLLLKKGDIDSGSARSFLMACKVMAQTEDARAQEAVGIPVRQFMRRVDLERVRDGEAETIDLLSALGRGSPPFLDSIASDCASMATRNVRAVAAAIRRVSGAHSPLLDDLLNSSACAPEVKGLILSFRGA